MPTIPRKRRLTAVIILSAVVLAIGGYAVFLRIEPLLVANDCQAGTGRSAVSLDPQQAAIAATIAGVAQRQVMPSRAVTVAYAAAMQESHLHNLPYGDRDSVGVFQQRPSQGWGPARKLRDPVYATTKFFRALSAIRGYQRMPVYRAAQAVQHSADGYAYAQYQRLAATLTDAFTGRAPHAVWCWPGASGHRTPELAAARQQLVTTFGQLRVARTASATDPPTLRVTARRPALGWAVAAWLVTHAARYQLGVVRFDGFEWRASSGSAGWTPDTGAGVRDEVQAS